MYSDNVFSPLPDQRFNALRSPGATTWSTTVAVKLCTEVGSGCSLEELNRSVSIDLKRAVLSTVGRVTPHNNKYVPHPTN